MKLPRQEGVLRTGCVRMSGCRPVVPVVLGVKHGGHPGHQGYWPVMLPCVRAGEACVPWSLCCCIGDCGECGFKCSGPLMRQWEVEDTVGKLCRVSKARVHASPGEKPHTGGLTAPACLRSDVCGLTAISYDAVNAL